MTKKDESPWVELYVAARSEWTERYRDFIYATVFWRRVAFAAMGVSALLGVGLIVVGSQSKMIPFVVKVDEMGTIAYAGPLDPTDWDDERLYRAQLASFITNWRTIVGDRSAQKTFLERTHALARGAAGERLREYYREVSPFDVMRKRTIEVEVTSMLRRGEKTFEATWRERARTLEGHLVTSRNFRGVFELEAGEPSPKNFANPLGLFVTRLSWTEPTQ
jgi:type IV secretion system protein TrbF